MRGESAVQPLYKQQTQPISAVVEWWAPYITEAAIGRVGRELEDEAALNLAEKSAATFIAALTRRSQLPLS